MKLTITAKHVELETADKTLAENLSNKLSDDFPKLNDLTMVVSQERGIYCIEARLTGKHVDFNASAKEDKIPAAIAAVIDKLGKQMRRFVDKFQDQAIKADPATKEKIWTSADIDA